MTQVFAQDGTRVPVTVIEAEPNTVTAVRTPERDGYAAVQLAGNRVKEAKLTKGELGHLAKADAPPSDRVVEFLLVEPTFPRSVRYCLEAVARALGAIEGPGRGGLSQADRLVGLMVAELKFLPLEQILDRPEVRHVFDSIKLGTTVPTPPVLIVQAVHDPIVAVEDIDELTDTYQSGGASVTYHRDMFSEHLSLHPLSAPMAFTYS